MRRCTTAFLILLLVAFSIAQRLPRRGALGIALTPIPKEIRGNLKDGEGALAKQVFPGLTGDKAGVKAGDIILRVNGKAATATNLPGFVRTLKVGQVVHFDLIREKAPLHVAAALVEKPRDPGTDAYSVQYAEVDTQAGRMRTIITNPKSEGRHPGLMFIQGYTPISYDFPLTAKGLDAPILFDFAKSGFVTMRVEKPGVGDSEGGPIEKVDYYTELDIYRQALKQLKALPNVNPADVFIFGHSMGGAFGPMVAAEIPVKGLLMYGIVSRTWHEYLLDTARYQGLLSGTSYADVDEQVREAGRILEMVFQDRKSPSEVIREHPEWKKNVEDTFPGGLFNGRPASFWGQLENANFASFWSKCNAPVLSVWGESDFVSYKLDHQLVADIVNSVHPGWGTFAALPNSDHLMATWPSQSDSLKHFGSGDFNPAIIQLMRDWVARISSS